MLPLEPQAWRRIMLIWQFLILTVLLVGVLVSASVYARALGLVLGRANARLKRIEDALVVANDRLLKRTEPVGTEPSRAISAKGDPPGYLTIRDLKVDSHRVNSQASYSSNRRSSVRNSHNSVNTIRSRRNASETIIEGVDSVATSSARETLEGCDDLASSGCTRSSLGDSASASVERCDRLETLGEPSSSTTVQPVSENCVTGSAAVQDPVETSGELPSLVSTVAASGATAEAKADSESRETLEGTSEPHDGPSNCAPSQDSVAKQNSDALLILSSQRRRRRARLGY
jgi:hypothetical protein